MPAEVQAEDCKRILIIVLHNDNDRVLLCHPQRRLGGCMHVTTMRDSVCRPRGPQRGAGRAAAAGDVSHAGDAVQHVSLSTDLQSLHEELREAHRSSLRLQDSTLSLIASHVRLWPALSSTSAAQHMCIPGFCDVA